MNRRAYIKNTLFLAAAGICSFSIIKWFDFNKMITPEELWSREYLLATLSDIIIPRTDTPGAKDANAHTYMIKVLLNCTSAKEQHRFLSGLKKLEEHTKKEYGSTFITISTTKQIAVLNYFANRAGYESEILNKINNKLLGTPFYTKLRKLTVEGYCLSKLGATQGLAYDYIPGQFEASVPLYKNQKSWATK